jgi:7 transmembrane receptor (rhodopsin family)
MYPSCLNLSNAHEISLCNDDTLDNGTSNSDAPFDENLEKLISKVVFVLFGIIFIVGLIGNLLVVIVVLFNPLMRSTTNYLIINLAIADLLFVLLCIPFTAR